MAVGDCQPVVPLARAVHPQPHQRRDRQVERPGGLLAHLAGHRRALLGRRQPAQVAEVDRQLGPPVDQLQRLGVAQQVAGGAQVVVRGDQGVDRALEGGRVEAGRLVQREAGDVVVRGALRIGQHLVEHARLKGRQGIGVHHVGRQRGGVVRVDHRQRRDRGELGGRLRLFGAAGEPAEHLGPEQVGDGERQPGGPGPADDPQREDGVAAEVEEVVPRADPGPPEDVGPDAGEHALGALGRRDVRLAAVVLPPVEPSERGAVHLAVRGERQGGVRHDQAGDHVVGQEPAEVFAQPPGAVGRVGPDGDVRDQPPAAVAVGRGDHDGVRHARVGAQRRLDLAQFDPVAADLDLVVDPAEELQLAVRQPAYPVAGAVQP